MLGEIKGYVRLKPNAVGQTPANLSAFRGKPCRAFEINQKSKSVLVIDPEAKALGMFDFDQCDAIFECDEMNGVLIPPGMEWPQKLAYMARLYQYPVNRKRDLRVLRPFIVAASLLRGEFCDSLYFTTGTGG